MKKNSGITLIALVITIVIMLILATISVTMLAGDNSLINNAGEAKEGVEEKNEKDIINLAVTTVMNNNEFGELVASELKAELERNYEDKIEIIDISSDSVQVTFKSGRTYLVGTDGSLIQPTDRTGIEIGSYVDYTPDVPNTTVYPHSTLDTYSGSTSNTADIIQDSLDWQVLRIYPDGSMDLIGNTTTQDIYFSGILGYTNGVYLMDDICKTLYSRNANEIEARSVDLEDFEYWLEKSTDGVTARNTYSNDTYTYGDSATYTGRFNKYPPFYKTQTSESNPGSLSTNTSYATDGDLTVEQTYYYISINDANFSDGYKALSSSLYYWLGSRVVRCASGIAYFGLRYAYANISGYNMFDSFGNTHNYHYRLRPVVHLKSSAKITANAGTTGEPHHITSY